MTINRCIAWLATASRSL